MPAVDSQAPGGPGLRDPRKWLFVCLSAILASTASCSEDSPTLGPPPVIAGSVRVPEDFTRLQDALSAVAAGCTVFVGPGTYRGAGNRDLTLRTPNVTILGTGGAKNTIIDCESGAEPHFGLIVAAPPESAYNRPCGLRGVRIQGAHAIQGAALRVETTQMAVSDCEFVENAADSAGAAYVSGARVDFVHCEFSRNRATGAGGAVLIRNGVVSFQGCTFGANHGSTGAAVTCRKSVVHASNCRVIGNGGGDRSGSAIWAESSVLRVDACLIAKNEARTAGGGIHSIRGILRVGFSTLAENRSDGPGGGLYIGELSSARLSRCIIALNCGEGGEDLYADQNTLLADACCLLDSVRAVPTCVRQQLGPRLDGDPGFVLASGCGISGESDFDLTENSQCLSVPTCGRIGFVW